PPLGSEFSFPVDDATFERLTEEAYFPRLLIVCVLPTDIGHWIRTDSSTDIFELRHLSYWCSLKSVAKTGRTKTSVSVPTSQVFSDRVLCEIMTRVRAEEDL